MVSWIHQRREEGPRTEDSITMCYFSAGLFRENTGSERDDGRAVSQEDKEGNELDPVSKGRR